MMASVSLEMLGFSLCFAFTRAGHNSHKSGLAKYKDKNV
jgi:hypothetical protein